MSQMDELRGQIEKIDEQMIDLFEERMGISAKVASYKKEHGIPVLDEEREKKQKVFLKQEFLLVIFILYDA